MIQLYNFGGAFHRFFNIEPYQDIDLYKNFLKACCVYYNKIGRFIYCGSNCTVAILYNTRTGDEEDYETFGITDCEDDYFASCDYIDSNWDWDEEVYIDVEKVMYKDNIVGLI